MEATTNFIGAGKPVGKALQLSFDWQALEALPKNTFNGKDYLIVTMWPLKKADDYGRTHTIVERIYKKPEIDNGTPPAKPKRVSKAKPKVAAKATETAQATVDDTPF